MEKVSVFLQGKKIGSYPDVVEAIYTLRLGYRLKDGDMEKIAGRGLFIALDGSLNSLICIKKAEDD